jgi:uncharacterized protein
MPNLEKEILQLVDTYSLEPHPEGGFYKELYRSAQTISSAALHHKFEGDRNYCTSIYFLLTSANFSGFHRIKQDEVWHFYAGHPLTVHVIDTNGHYKAHVVGFDLKEGLAPQLVVPAGAWFASSVNVSNAEVAYSFVGCTVAPGFDFRDFELADRDELIAAYPQHEEIITKLTRV